MRKKIIIKRVVATWLVLLVSSLSIVMLAQDGSKSKVTLKVENMVLSEVLETISNMTGVQFFYNHSQIDVKGKVSYSFNNENLDKVLDIIFKDKPVDIEFQQNKIVVLKQSDKVSSLQMIPKFKISGKVVDSRNKEELPGAAVILENNKLVGVATDIDGNFVMEVPEGTTALLFSYLGFNEARVDVKGDMKDLLIQLSPVTSELDDVVVTGMAPRKTESFTGSYVTVKGEELKKLNPNNLMQALQYYDPSFRIKENNLKGADPNQMPEFRLRGDAQLGSSDPSNLQLLMGDYSNRPNMPLLILDGFETTLQRIVDMDPERVESITILKDASATAIYGSRAANGVIIFETKKPLPGAINISYSTNFGVTIPDLSDYNMMNAEEKLEYERMAGLFPENDITKLNYYNKYREEILRGVDTYWLSAPVRTAVTQRHTVSMQGGDQAIRYSLNVNYSLNPGVIKQSDRNSMGLSFNLQYRKNNWNINNQLSLSDTRADNSSYGSFSQFTRMNQYYRKYDENGIYTKFIEDKFLSSGTMRQRIYNPLYNTQFANKDFNKNFSVTDNFNIEWNPIETLRFSTGASFTKGMAQSEKFLSRNNTSFETVDDLTKRGSYAKSTGETLSWSLNSSVNYNYVHEKHTLSSYARWNIEEAKSNAVNLLATGFPNDAMNDFLFGYEMNQRPTGGETTTRSVGVIGQLSYLYDFRYAADFSIRGDLSSQFGANTGMAPFWATGVRWNMDKESWMKNTIFSSLVLRASMGVTGSQNYSPYQAIESYTFANLMFPYLSSDVLGAELMGIGNPDLGWSTTQDRTISLDFGLLKDRISGGVSMYNNKTDDLLLDYTLAPSAGFRTIVMNAGSLENKGVDVQLSVIPFVDYERRIQWVVSANAAHNVNRIKKISNVLKKMNEANYNRTDAPLPIYEEGKSTSQIFSVVSLGIDPATGEEVFLKRNGMKTFVWDPADKVSVGDTEPKLQGAITSSLNYKNLSFSLATQYQFGGYRYNSTLVDKLEKTNIAYNLDRRALSERWSVDNRHAKYKAVTILGSNTPQSSRFVQKFDEFALSSIAVGYRFEPKEWPALKRYRMDVVNVNFSMQDIFRISTIKQERGLDYPFARSFNLSVSFIFN